MTTVHLVQPCNRTMKPLTAMSVAMALSQGGFNCSWAFAADSDIGRSRSYEATKFVSNQTLGEVMVFVDDDIGFDVGSFKHLVNTCAETKEIVCGMYVVRDTTNPHVALAPLPEQQIRYSDTYPVPIKWGATGFMAIHRRVLEKLQDKYPWGYEVPVVSGPRFIVPFFLEMIHEGEYLSEDYAFCQRAATVGIKTWLDPRIKLRHLGEREYSAQDLAADALRQTVTVTIDEGGPDPTGVVDDLRDFLGLDSRLEAWQLISQTPFRKPLAEEWQTKAPITPYQVNQFYAQTEHYLLELAKFNTMGSYGIRSSPALRHYRERVIDFGGGIGTLSLQLAKMGRQVTYVDLPSRHQQFAEFRFRKRRADIRVASNLVELPDASHDCLVAADVLEHIHPELLPVIVQEMWRVLAPGAIVIEISDFGNTQEQPYHFETEDLFRELMTAQGFVEQGDNWTKPAGVPAEAQQPAMTAA